MVLDSHIFYTVGPLVLLLYIVQPTGRVKTIEELAAFSSLRSQLTIECCTDRDKLDSRVFVSTVSFEHNEPAPQRVRKYITVYGCTDCTFL